MRRRTACGLSFAGHPARSETGDPHYRRKGMTVSSRPVANPAVPATEIPAGTPIVAGLPMPEFRRIGVEPISGACGCEITGVDLRQPLDAETLAEVMKAFEQFLVIVFRDQDLTPEQHKAFSRYFGELTELPQAPTYAGHRDMQEVRREAHEPENVVPSFEHFHTDSPFLPTPPKCIVMRALEVPQWGGDTAFSNAYLVYEHLSDGMKTLLDGLQGRGEPRPRWRARLASPWRKTHERLEFLRGRLAQDAAAGLLAEPDAADGSHRLRGAADSDVLIVLEEGARDYAAGDLVEVLAL